MPDTSFPALEDCSPAIHNHAPLAHLPVCQMAPTRRESCSWFKSSPFTMSCRPVGDRIGSAHPKLKTVRYDLDTLNPESRYVLKCLYFSFVILPSLSLQIARR